MFNGQRRQTDSQSGAEYYIPSRRPTWKGMLTFGKADIWVLLLNPSLNCAIRISITKDLQVGLVHFDVCLQGSVRLYFLPLWYSTFRHWDEAIAKQAKGAPYFQVCKTTCPFLTLETNYYFFLFLDFHALFFLMVFQVNNLLNGSVSSSWVKSKKEYRQNIP